MVLSATKRAHICINIQAYLHQHTSIQAYLRRPPLLWSQLWSMYQGLEESDANLLGRGVQ
jgi:phage-related protein